MEVFDLTNSTKVELLVGHREWTKIKGTDGEMEWFYGVKNDFSKFPAILRVLSKKINLKSYRE